MGALPTAAATYLCINDGITQPERIISASAHKRAVFGYILNNKKDRCLKIDRGVNHSRSYTSIELWRNQ